MKLFESKSSIHVCDGNNLVVKKDYTEIKGDYITINIYGSSPI